jgi:hypothetical protein
LRASRLTTLEEKETIMTDVTSSASEANRDHPQSVLCEQHGLRYNPHTHFGCVRCRGIAAPTHPAAFNRPSTTPPLVFWLLAGAAVLAVITLVYSNGNELDEFEDGAVVAEQPVTSTLSASTPELSADTGDVASAKPASASRPKTSDWPTHEGVGEIFIKDKPESEPFLIDGKPAPDLASVRFRGANGHLTVTFEFTGDLERHARDMAVGIAPAVAFLDRDLDASTGEKGFAGRTGFEQAVVGYLGVRYDADSDSYFWAGGQADTEIFDFVCSHDVGTVSGYFLDATYDPDDDDALANTSCSGNTLTARVPYERLGVAAGQTVRIATEENMGGGKVEQYFLDDALLTLE